jgi:hypothetical protein
METEDKNWRDAEVFAFAALRKEYSAGKGLSDRQVYGMADRENWFGRSLTAAIDTMHDRNDGHIKIGLDSRFRSGKDSSQQVPIEARIPFPSLNGHMLVRMDYVSVDSGLVDYLDPIVGGGTNRIPLGEKASGIALGVGWQADSWQVDIGTTPLGFNERTLVGGFGIQGDLKDVGWNFQASRRAEFSNVLAYAGMKVPATAAIGAGTEWGGVVRTGAKLGLSYDQGGANGYWASLQYHLMEGDSVADNTRLGILGGVYHRLIDEENRGMRIGLNILHFQYDKNLSEYTLQHGSYFSPQNYVSASIPVSYFGRSGDTWSYLLAASISHSWSDEDAPYQLGGSDSSGGGFGYSLEAAVEKRISKRWYLGLAADVQRADFYEPNHLLMYAKYTFSDRWQPIEMPPEVPIPYSEFD